MSADFLLTEAGTTRSWSAVICGVNSSYTQTNPAIRSLAAWAAERLSTQILIREYQTGQPVDVIARDLLDSGADFYAFSCYIWNRRLVFDLIASLRRMRPQAWIAVGGPEVSYDATTILDQVPEIDFIISGEGEVSFSCLLAQLEGTSRAGTGSVNDALDFSGVPGLTCRISDCSLLNSPATEPIELASLPFPYETDLSEMSERLLYYESSRGCPFNCTYCLSAIDRDLRFRPLDQTLAHLDRFIEADVKLVKFVDRTFNCNPARARAIWTHLINRRLNQGFRTCFHFELAGDLLEPVDLELLAEAPVGLFQFEIGVQSVKPATLKQIKRACDLPRLYANFKTLRASRRQHLHLDLIAGLPGETLADVIDSFNVLYQLQPDQLQLGFLKLLPGTPILKEIASCGYRYQPFPPYEVLASNTLTAESLSLLHAVEEVLEMFANSQFFSRTLNWLVPQFASPFEFFRALSAQIVDSGKKMQSFSIDQRASMLRQLASDKLEPAARETVAGLLRADHYASGRKDAPRHLDALEATADEEQRKIIALLRRNRLPGSRIRVEAYPFSLASLLSTGEPQGEPEWAIYDLSGASPVLAETLSPDELSYRG
ncbi:MAG: DUF4080 domain-containing protein [Saccharofermentanales bacterium]|jgi:radical SAM superfamily enzyme YgiQ (UPF0313 family)